MARRGTDIIDWLPQKIERIDRREIETRLKPLRLAGLYPLARSTADHAAVPPNERHMSNLLQAILGTDSATLSAEAVRALTDMPFMGEMKVADSWVFASEKGEQAPTFGEYLEHCIRSWRRNQLPWPGDYAINEIIVWHGPQRRAVMTFHEVANPKDGVILTWSAPAPTEPTKLRVIEQRSISGSVIGTFAEFLGPAEAPAV